ncbi:hypothetical protein [Streptomyces sp.]|uniref:hypothetical protein n=1 Tax=Streptomyces sp. TaxID=1931 RepID=UPI002F3F8827
MHTRLTTAALTAAALLALAACSSTDESKPGFPPGTKVATAPPISAPTVPSPDAAQQTALLGKLTGIDPGLTVSPDRAIRRAVNSCETLHTNPDRKAAVHTIALRFDGGNAHIDDAKAERIAAAIEATFCK